ncbi:MAG: hypothetical protein KatS3mg020_0692 [Fimbriimonadales bacterium]|nr:MAG: hypothetical protein KatS3mg019_0410 [Fimbriimonadales bacterium]GIV11201.1 MAG: hypothetical protein KatS3mg020_0692 [Fimbriimonadales bacterium]
MNKTKIAVALAIVVTLLIGVRIVISLATPQAIEPRTRIQQIFAEGKQAFENENIDGMLEFLSDEFSWGGQDKQRLRYRLALLFKNAENPRAQLGELQIEIFGGRAIVKTPVRITWRDAQNPSGLNSQDFGVVEFEFRKVQQRKWLIINYEDWRLLRVETTQMGDFTL